MSYNENDVLFTAIDPFGYPIVLTSSRYYGHILSSDNNHQAHPEFTPEEVKKTIEHPAYIFESNRPNADVYFAKNCSQHPDLFLKVAVEKYDKYGFVSTVFPVPKVKGGIKEEGLKYANYKSELR